MALDFERLSASTIESLTPAHTVFFFPVGSLEDHGPHLPVGLDLSEAEQLCRLAAEKLERDLPGWKGVIMPTAPLSVSSDTTRLAITVRAHVLRDWLVDACHALERSGFSHFVCFSGNLGPRQLTAIEEAGKIICRRGPISMALEWLGRKPGQDAFRPSLVSVASGLISANRVMQSPLWPDPVEHGGRRDTSVALALKAVAPESIADLRARPRSGTRWSRFRDRWRRRTSGYWGPVAPSEATAAWGQSVLESTVNDAFPKLRAVWEGANPNFLFRSYYSVFPPNKSFFKGWLLTVLLIGIILAWYVVTFQSLGLSQ